jgi:uncharacterized membrane protein YfcA
MLMNALIDGTIYILIGIFAGLMAGILGLGGGIVVVPGLAFIFQLRQLVPEQVIMHAAAGTSLAVMIFTAQASLRAHYKMGEILWSVFNKLWPGIAMGTVSGAVIAGFISTHWLKTIFAVFLLFVVVKMLTDVHLERGERFPKTWLNGLISFLIGLKSGLLGIGGGVLIIPYLGYCGVAVRKIPAVSNLCSFTVALVGTAACMLTGRYEMAAVPYSTGYIYWPAVLWVAIPSCLIAPYGTKLNYLLPVQQLKYGFIVILLLTAIKMFF